MNYVFGGFIALIVSAVIFLFGLLFVIVYADFSGNIGHEYRCVNHVLESRETFFGHGIGSMDPLSGAANEAACK